MAETSARSPRRTFVPVVLAGLASGALVAVAGNQAWVSADLDASGSGGNAAVASAIVQGSSEASSPPATAVALVVLACWGVVLVSRGRFRRAVAWFGGLAALLLLVTVVLGWWQAPDELRAAFADSGVSDVVIDRTVWCWVAVVSAMGALGAAVLGVRGVAGWPEMGSRYDAPGSSSDGDEEPPSGSDQGVEPQTDQSNLDLWRSIDEGRDPTA